MKRRKSPARWWRRQNGLVKALCAIGLILAAGALVLAAVEALRHFKPSLFPASTPEFEVLQVPTPEPPQSLLPEAAALCERAFTQPVGQGSPKAYLLYLQSPGPGQEGWKVGIESMSPFDPPYLARGADEVQTLVCVKRTRARVATYGGRIPGYRVDWDIRLVNWPGGVVLGSESYVGDRLPDSIAWYGTPTAKDVYHGDEPSLRAVSDWLAATVVDDTVLHLEDEMEALVFSPSGNLLAAGGSHGKVRIWEVTGGPAASWPEVAAFGAPSGHLVFSPDGRLLATSSYEETKLWDVATWQELRRIDGIGTTCFSPDGRWLAATTAESGTDKTVLWDVQSGERGRSFDGSVGAFLPGEMLLTTYRQSGVTVWDITSGEEVRFYARMGRYFSPDGQLSASRGQNGQAILFDMETGEEVHVLGKPGTDVLRLAFSPDGALLASTRRMWQTVTLWDVSTGQVARVLRWHWNHIFGIAFSPDGRLLATGAYDGVIKVWDTATW